jgi:hypothetical protein
MRAQTAACRASETLLRHTHGAGQLGPVSAVPQIVVQEGFDFR